MIHLGHFCGVFAFLNLIINGLHCTQLLLFFEARHTNM